MFNWHACCTKKSLHLLLKFIEFSCLSKLLFYISSFNHVSLKLCSYLYSYRTDPMTRYLKRVAVDSYFYEEKWNHKKVVINSRSNQPIKQLTCASIMIKAHHSLDAVFLCCFGDLPTPGQNGKKIKMFNNTMSWREGRYDNHSLLIHHRNKLWNQTEILSFNSILWSLFKGKGLTKHLLLSWIILSQEVLESNLWKNLKAVETLNLKFLLYEMTKFGETGCDLMLFFVLCLDDLASHGIYVCCLYTRMTLYWYLTPLKAMLCFN